MDGFVSGMRREGIGHCRPGFQGMKPADHNGKAKKRAFRCLKCGKVISLERLEPTSNYREMQPLCSSLLARELMESHLSNPAIHD